MGNRYYALYKIASCVAHPFLPRYLRRRALQGKEDLVRVGERFGKANLLRPNAPLVWIHAASMGESQSVLPLIKAWLEAYPTLQILLTTVTLTSARFVAPRLGERAFHQFAPMDTPQALSRFLKHWRPDMAVFVDSELWPNSLIQMKAHGTPIMLLNGRISARSAKRWKPALPLIRQMLECFTHIYAKSDEDALRLKTLGALDVRSFGNLKFSAPPLSVDNAMFDDLTLHISNRPIWLASSTHAGEEAIAAQIHAALRSDTKGLLTVIVPRHSSRGDAVRTLLEAEGLQVSQRSRGEAIVADTDIYLADTMGELGLFYRLCPIVFIGGSLVKHGGQNPLEPAHLGCAILYGSHMHNFSEACIALEQGDAAIEVLDAVSLQKELLALLKNPLQVRNLGKAALQVMHKHAKVGQHVMASLSLEFDAIVNAYAKST